MELRNSAWSFHYEHNGLANKTTATIRQHHSSPFPILGRERHHAGVISVNNRDIFYLSIINCGRALPRKGHDRFPNLENKGWRSIPENQQYTYNRLCFDLR